MACYFALLLLLCTKLFFLHPVTLFEIDFKTIEGCKDEKKFFQISNLQCGDCEEASGKTVSADGLSCTCKTDYFISQYFGGPEISCTRCSPGQVSSEDKWFCISCPAGGTCDCPVNTKTVERELDGTQKTTRECLTCASTSSRKFALYPSSDQAFCKYCPSCTVPIPSLPDTKVLEITYDNEVKLESDFLVRNFATAKTLCEVKKNLTACQLLGNMCVMLDYKLDGDNPCQGYQDVLKNNGEKVRSKDGVQNVNWAIFMPWLYYTNNQPEVELNKEDITRKFETEQAVPFVLAVYAANGSFVGLKTNIFSELQMCTDRASKLNAANKFATLYENSCDLNVGKLWEQQEMYFYDLYFQSSSTTLYATPLVLENYKDNNAESFKSWELLRRFFLVDNLSGRPKTSGSDPKASADKVIRVAELIQLNIRLRNGQGQIYPPYIKVRYTSIKLNDDILKRDPTVRVSFQVHYEMDTSSISQNVKTAVGVLSGFAIVYGIILVYSWRRREGIEVIDLPTMLHFVAFCLGSLATMYFWVLFGLSSLWLIFFKEQTVVYRLLPTSEQENIFRNLLIIAFVFKFIDLIHVVGFQISVDVFFVDWERPRPLPRATNQSVDAKAPVSVWRTLFIGNEWNELQTLRKISPEIQMGFVLFFLKAVGFEHLTTTDPVRRYSVDYTTDYVGEQSHLLRFAVVVLLYMSIAFVQWVFFAFIYERFLGDPFGDFIDLCSMANISVMIFRSKLYGYYIHGRSVHGRSDTDMLEMHEQFKREENDLCGKRGLEPNSDRQTFEVMVTRKFRASYDRFYDPIRTQTQNIERRNVPAIQGHTAGVNLSVAVQQTIEAYSSVNRFLTAFIDHSLRDDDYAVKNKLLLERILDLELGELPQDKALFYNDDSRSFTNVFFFGHEWTLLLWEVLFFAIVDYVALNLVLAGVLTYLQGRILKSIREILGKKNLARKTLVDERFLI